MHPRTEMLDLVVVDGKARGIVTRDLQTGAIDSHVGDAVVLATGGYSNVFYLSTKAKASNCTAIWRAHRRGAFFGNPCFTQDPSDVHPTIGRAPVEADADVGIAPERRTRLGPEEEGRRPSRKAWQRPHPVKVH